jgi:hypothetical protein
MPRKTETSDRVVGGFPAPPGWRVLFLTDSDSATNSDGRGYFSVPVAAWLLVRTIAYDAGTFQDIPQAEQSASDECRIVAGTVGGTYPARSTPWRTATTCGAFSARGERPDGGGGPRPPWPSTDASGSRRRAAASGRP